MLLGDTDVEKSVRIRLGERGETCALRHGGGDGDDFVILSRQPYHGSAEYAGIRGCTFFPGGALACCNIEGTDAVELGRILCCRRIPFSLGGHNVDQHRPFQGIDPLQDFDQHGEVVTLERSDVIEAERFEEGAGGEEPFQ